MNKKLVFVTFFAFSIVAASRVYADPHLPEKFDVSLTGLQFGWTIDQTVEFLKKRVEDRYGVLIRDTMDVRNRDQLRREAIAEAATIGTEIVKFDGSDTRWNVSEVKDEFRHGFGEEMLHVKEGATHLYFYYVDGALYKLQMTLPKDQQKEFLKAVVRAYGEPTITSEKGGFTADANETVRVWADTSISFSVTDHSERFQCFSFRWADARVDAIVKAKWPHEDADTINPLILESMEWASDPNSEEYGEDFDPVGDMLGVSPTPTPKPEKKPAKSGKAKPRKK